MSTSHDQNSGSGRHGLPGTVWILGFASLFMDASSELVYSLLPVFMTVTLGASVATVGAIEGVAEATASITKVFSGLMSDRWRQRKPLVLFGYSLAAATKPMFPLAPSIGWVFGARFVDRIGKGIRGAPRDALIADVTPGDRRATAYGLRQALDSVGAILGPLAAMGLMAAMADRMRSVLWFAVAPAIVCVGLIAFGVREPARATSIGGGGRPVAWRDLGRLPVRYWWIVGVGAIFTLARFSEAFLVLRGRDLGLALAFVPAVMVVMNVVYAATAYPAGWAGDRFKRRYLLVAGLAVLVVADVALATAGSPAGAFAGAALWGLHMGLTQGLFSALVADAAPADLRGSAFGAFNLTSGVAMLLASVIAGALWTAVGASATFVASAVFAIVATVGLLVVRS